MTNIIDLASYQQTRRDHLAWADQVSTQLALMAEAQMEAYLEQPIEERDEDLLPWIWRTE